MQKLNGDGSIVDRSAKDKRSYLVDKDMLEGVKVECMVLFTPCLIIEPAKTVLTALCIGG